MADYDSILNVEEFIADHYFTTDETKGKTFGKRVAERVKEWKAEEAAGPFERLTSRRAELEKLFAAVGSGALAEAAPGAAFRQPSGTVRLAAALREVLGFAEPEAVAVTTAAGREMTVSAAKHPGAWALEVPAVSSPEELSETTVRVNRLRQGEAVVEQMTIAGLVSELFLAQDPPQFIVLMAGNWVILAGREQWPLGRYIAVNLALAVERGETENKGELQRAVCILARLNAEKAADGSCWWADTLTESLEHAVQVSADLRIAVRQSIEILGNDVVARLRAQGVRPEDIDGDELAKQALRYLYRILFVLFAETRPELEILPVGTPEYDEGYGLARLRELVLRAPQTAQAEQGTHLYYSLDLLFRLIDRGHEGGEEGLTFRSLKADLFQPEAVELIARAKLSNLALHRVLENLLLTRAVKGRDRGFISYATLGVSELGQVYEGLMSFKGFITDRDLVEVAPNGDAEKGSWLVTPRQAEELPEGVVVTEQVPAPDGGTLKKTRVHRAGTFVFRQSSRDRERSASFYTPQVLTEFTVGQAIEVLREEGRVKTSADVLSLSVCEPALGSGAFAVEAVRQLAELYLELYQEEAGEPVPSGEYAAVLQRVKAHIALHQVYGVDLNSTAVELAEISLWLDTMTSDLKAPWFGLHLRRGNSLIGASRATYSDAQIRDKRYLNGEPTKAPVSDLAAALAEGHADAKVAGQVHHFLLPASGWGAAADAKDLKSFAAAEQKQMKAWRTRTRHKLTGKQIKELKDLAVRVERLWGYALTRMQIAEDQARRDIDFPGHVTDHSAKNITREQIEQELLNNENGAYGRLRAVMDAWNALWFWPLDQVDQLPEVGEWIDGLQALFGSSGKARGAKADALDLASNPSWEEVGAAEDFYLMTGDALSLERARAEHPWLVTAREVAAGQGFFHWDLDFAAVFARGGFDLQVGNPPWVRPDVNFDELLAESDPWFKLAHKPTQKQKRERQQAILGPEDSRSVLARQVVMEGVTETVTTAAVLSDPVRFPHLLDQRPDLYRGFMQRTWANAGGSGVVGLIHPESHFTEKKAAPLRKAAYLRLRRHWQFINELSLFDIDHHNSYGIHVYGVAQSSPEFLSAVSMYHPKSAEDSLVHDGSGAPPGIKDDNDKWDLRPHHDRIIRVDDEELKVWRSILEQPGTPLYETRMVYTVNREAADVLAKMAAAPRVRQLGLQFSGGWNETTARKNGYFDVEWGHPDSWDDAILQGPHLGVGLPMQKQPNPTMKHNQDWTEIDLETLPEGFIPATAYKPRRSELAAERSGRDYDADYGCWEIPDGNRVPVASTYRIAWRRMAANTGFRTLYPAVIPPGSCHVDPVFSAGLPGRESHLMFAGGVLSSLLVDFFVRSTGGGDIRSDRIESLPYVRGGNLEAVISRAFLLLNAVTKDYGDIYELVTGDRWNAWVPLRGAEERRRAQIEIDAAVALGLGVTVDELCTIYRTQFPVMLRYDRTDRYDANGRLVPKEILKLQEKLGDEEGLSKEQRTWTHPQSGVEYVFEYPFRQLDREADIREAYERLRHLVEE